MDDVGNTTSLSTKTGVGGGHTCVGAVVVVVANDLVAADASDLSVTAFTVFSASLGGFGPSEKDTEMMTILIARQLERRNTHTRTWPLLPIQRVGAAHSRCHCVGGRRRVGVPKLSIRATAAGWLAGPACTNPTGMCLAVTTRGRSRKEFGISNIGLHRKCSCVACCTVLSAFRVSFE